MALVTPEQRKVCYFLYLHLVKLTLISMNIDPHIFRAYDIRGVVETALKPEVVKLDWPSTW